MPAGRPPKPTAVLERQGTRQKCRHEKRKHEPHSGGRPQPPSSLKGEALRFWLRNEPHWTEMGILEAVDADSLFQLCISWTNWLKIQRRFDKGRATIYEVTTAMKSWANLASKFGMSPIDRIKLATEAKEEPDPLFDILRGVGSRN